MPPSGAVCRVRVRMRPREIDEPHRTASQLELLFDLTFVVAVAAVTARFAHDIADGNAVAGLVPFLQVFFAVWWAWMNFTWFASSYDTDDVAYRLLTMVQMAGVLVLAAGVPAAAGRSDYRAVAIGYLIMRTALVAQWLRAGREDPAGRRTALRYALGITVAQAGWILWLVSAEAGILTSTAQVPFFVVLAFLELAVPRWAERTSPTTWHPHHIAERYGLFTIILFGESVLAASNAVARGWTRRTSTTGSSSSPVPASSCCSPSGGSTSSSPQARASTTAATSPTGGATVTTASSRASPRSAPGLRSQSSRRHTTSRRHLSPSATPSRSQPRCTSCCSGGSTCPSWARPSCVPRWCSAEPPPSSSCPRRPPRPEWSRSSRRSAPSAS
nr:low temperature requirement protein A [Actinomadura sp. J1-007]